MPRVRTIYSLGTRSFPSRALWLAVAQHPLYLSLPSQTTRHHHENDKDWQIGTLRNISLAGYHHSPQTNHHSSRAHIPPAPLLLLCKATQLQCQITRSSSRERPPHHYRRRCPPRPRPLTISRSCHTTSPLLQTRQRGISQRHRLNVAVGSRKRPHRFLRRSRCSWRRIIISSPTRHPHVRLQ